MSDQVYDTLRWTGASYHITAAKGSGLFVPQEHGLRPVQFMSTCRRGYYCRYAVEAGRLVLTEVHAGLDEQAAGAAMAGEGPILFGRTPRRYMMHAYRLGGISGGQMGRTSLESPDWVYSDLHEPLAFSGGLVVAVDTLADLYPYSGERPGYVFALVNELLFEQGRVTRHIDHSADMARLREHLGRSADQSSGGASSPWKQWLLTRGYGSDAAA